MKNRIPMGVLLLGAMHLGPSIAATPITKQIPAQPERPDQPEPPRKPPAEPGVNRAQRRANKKARGRFY